ncbi:unnamed protein product [Brassicogethes aeneus]|uniref:Cyclic nucleotide-binding domain-containing protein n=1 Tax=Brassicogethes aeneus TaxID=1431903 RepID=A0A9P0BC72_BRAAE|nr:unnamed protein product [Brassicogethes aeneus]
MDYLTHSECKVEPLEPAINSYIQTGCCINFRRKIKGIFLVYKKHPEAQKYFPSTTALENERGRHASNYFYTVHPFSVHFIIKEHMATWVDEEVSNNPTYLILATLGYSIKILFFVDVNFGLDSSNVELVVYNLWLWCGFMLQIFVLISILKVIKILTCDNQRHQRFTSELDQYMTIKGVPPSIKKNVFNYFDQKIYGTLQKQSFLQAILSTNLNIEIKENFVKNLMSNVHFLHIMPKQCVNNLMNKLKLQIYFPNEVVIRCGQKHALNMYFIYTGTVAVYSEEGIEICHLDDGSNFGELGIILDQPRKATIVAATTCKLYVLTKTDFIWCFHQYPGILENIKQHSLNQMGTPKILKTTVKNKENGSIKISKDWNNDIRVDGMKS